MTISASVFTDPTMRVGLQQYYDTQKAAAVAAWKAREDQPAGDVKIPTGDGGYKTVSMIPISADQMEKAFVSFDKWLEFQADFADNEGIGPARLARAQQRLDDLQAQSPDSSSNVRTTFSTNGKLLAYINADGSLVTSNIGAAPGEPSPTPMETRLQAISQAADNMGLTGQRRIDYLNREVGNALGERYRVNMTSYDAETSPTKREFGEMWYPNFDVDQVYNDALKDAQASYDEANAWYKQWQGHMNDIQSFLLSLQESA